MNSINSRTDFLETARQLFQPYHENGKFGVTLVNPQVSTYHKLSYLPDIQGSLEAVQMCTPKDVNVTIADENVRSLELEQIAENSDLVGVTAATAMAPRGYEIIRRLRELRKDIQIVMGGIHPTFLPDEALEHGCDAVVQGEAEGVWSELLEDAQAGSLKKIYDGRTCRPETWEIPFVSQLSFVRPILASRGCPHPCEFCCTPAMTGRRQRCLPVDKIVEAIERDLPFWSGIVPQVIPFYDDNLLANRKRAEELAEALRPLGVRWASMSSIDTADDEDFLRFLRASGYVASLIGFESINAENLRSVGKRVNTVRDYREAVARMHKCGISVIGSFILGMDHDTSQSIRDMIDALIDMKLDMATFSILTAFPGTQLYKRMDEEGRIIHRQWDKYTAGLSTLRPKNMTPLELQDILEKTRRRFFSPRSILSRIGSVRNKPFTLAINVASHRAFRENGPVVSRRSSVIE